MREKEKLNKIRVLRLKSVLLGKSNSGKSYQEGDLLGYGSEQRKSDFGGRKAERYRFGMET